MIIVIFLLTDRPAREGIRRRSSHTGSARLPSQLLFSLPSPDWQWSGKSRLYPTWAQGSGELCAVDPSKGTRRYGRGGAMGAGLRFCGQLRHCLAAEESREGQCLIMVDTCYSTLTLFRCCVAPTVCTSEALFRLV